MSSSSIIHSALFGVLACGIAGALGVSAQAGPGLTDPQIANIAYTADTIDIQNGELALRKSHNPDVRAFANVMVRDHTAVNKQALALVKKLHVTPEDNPTSESLKKAANDERDKLDRLNGAAFDKAYIANEVAYHKAVNNALRTTLIPSAQNTQLKNFLQAGLKIFESHEQHAEHLNSQLQ